MAILPRRELEEALLEIGLITDVMNKDFDGASVFLLLSTFLLLLGGLHQQSIMIYYFVISAVNENIWIPNLEVLFRIFHEITFVINQMYEKSKNELI